MLKNKLMKNFKNFSLKKVSTITMLIVLFTNNLVVANMRFKLHNTAPVGNLNATVLHKKKLNLQVLTDYTGQNSTNTQSKLNGFKTDMATKKVDVDFSLTSSIYNIAYDKDKENIFIHLSDAIGTSFSFVDLNKKFMNKLVSNNFSIYSITPKVNWDYKILGSTTQDITIRQLVNSSAIDGKLYDSTTGGLSQLHALLSYLKNKYSSNEEELYKVESSRKVDLIISTDYTGTKLDNLKAKFNNLKAKGTVREVDLQYNIVDGSSKVYLGAKTNTIKDFASATKDLTAILNTDGTVWVAYQDNAIKVKEITNAKEINCIEGETSDSSILTILNNDGSVTKLLFDKTGSYKILNNYNYPGRTYISAMSSLNQTVAIDSNNNVYNLDTFRLAGSGAAKLLAVNKSGTSYIYQTINNEIGYFGFSSTATNANKSFGILSNTANAQDVSVAEDKTLILLANGSVQFSTIPNPGGTSVSQTTRTDIPNVVDVEVSKNPSSTNYVYFALDNLGKVYSTKYPSTKMQLINGISNVKKIYAAGAKAYFVDVNNEVYVYNHQLTTPTLEKLTFNTSNVSVCKTTNTGDFYRFTTDKKITDGTYPNIMKNFSSSSYDLYSVNLDNIKSFSFRSDSEKYFLYISDGEGTNYPQGFGGYYSMGGLTNSFKDYLNNNNIIPYIFSPKGDHDYIMKPPDINSQKQEISLQTLADKCIGKLFSNTEIDKALDDFIMHNVNIKYLTDNHTNSSNYNDIISKTNSLNTDLYPFNTNIQFNPSKDIMNDILADDDIIQVSIGEGHSAFLSRTGGVYTVGRNFEGQLGLGDTYDRITPTKVQGLPKIKQIACDGYRTFALAETGELYRTGEKMSNAPNSNIFVKVEGIPKIKQISLYDGATALALTEDGEVYSATKVKISMVYIMDQFIKVEGIPKIKQISGGADNSVILAEDGRVFAKGRNNSDGYLGVESENSVRAYVEIPVSVKVKKVVTGTGNYAIITEGGDLYVVGRNGYSSGTSFAESMGMGAVRGIRWYTKVNNIPKVKDVVLADHCTVILTEDKELYVSGQGRDSDIPFPTNGRFINGFMKFDYKSLNPEMGDIESIATYNTYYTPLIVISNGEPYGIGKNTNGSLGVGEPGKYYEYANDGETGEWRDNDVSTFMKCVFNTKVEKIVATRDSSLFITEDKDLFFTGDLGQDTLNSIIRRHATYSKDKTIGKARDIFGNKSNAAVINEDNEVYVRGANDNGELGLNNKNVKLSFTKLEGFSDVKQIDFGPTHALLLKNNGDLYVSGSGYGLGIPDVTSTMVFIKIEGIPRIKQVSCGNGYSLVLTEDGDVLGAGIKSKIETGSYVSGSPRLYYEKIEGLPKIKKVIAGYDYNILISEIGEVYVRGNNKYGCIGLDKSITITSNFIKLEGLPPIKDATTYAVDELYYRITILLSEDGEMFHSGYDVSGNMTSVPLESGQSRYTFLKIPNVPKMKQVSAGYNFAIGLTEDGSLYFSSANSGGETTGTGLEETAAKGFNPKGTGLPNPGFKIDTSNLARFKGANDKYLVYVGNGKTLQDLPSAYKQHLLDNKVTFVGASPADTFDNSIGSDTFRGLANATSGDLFETIDGAMNFIKNKYTQLFDTRKSGYIAVNEDRLKYSKTYDDYERDTANKNLQYKERWNYAHNKDFFENNMGYMSDSISMADYNTGKRNWSDYLLNFITEKDFDKVGEYVVSYQAQDNPSINNASIDGTIPDYSKFENYNRTSMEIATSKVKIYANRRPIARFTYTLSGTSFNKNNTSFDYDHLSKSNKGIVSSTWKYKALDDSDWTIGEPPTTFEADKIYMVSLTVKDEDGYVSKPYTRVIGLQDNLPPVAEFTLDKNVMDYNKVQTNLVHDFSSDPEQDPLNYHWWAVDKATGTTVKDWGTTTPNIQDLVNMAKTLGVNKTYIVKLQVEDNPSANPMGGRTGLPKLKSNIAEQQLMIGRNNAPIADFEMKAAMIEGSMNTIKDKSYDPDLDSIQEYHWWVLDKASGFPLSTFTDLSSPPNLSLLPVGDYKVKLVVKDKPKFGEALESTPCIKDLKVIPKYSGLIIDATPTSMYWTNQEISVDIEAKGGYNFKFMQWVWSKSYNKPIFIESNKSTNMKQNVKLHNIKDNEGMWYLHMKGQDEFSEAYNYRYFYCMDVTKPIISYDFETYNLNVVDILSGVKEKGVSYRWINSETKLADSDFTGFTVWDGLSNVIKPTGNNLYLHVKAFDNAGNMGYEVFGPYNDPAPLISIEGTLTPGTAKRGQKVTFNITVTGAKTLTINFPTDLISKDPNPVVNIDKFKNMQVDTLDKHTLTYTYYVPLEAIEKDGYKFTAVAENNGATASCDLFLNVRGSIYDGLKTEIKY